MVLGGPVIPPLKSAFYLHLTVWFVGPNAFAGQGKQKGRGSGKIALSLRTSQALETRMKVLLLLEALNAESF